MAPFRFAEWCLRGEEIQLFGDGKQSRDFTYVDDIALGTIAALQKRLPGFEIINLGGGGERTTILEMIEMIGEFAGKSRTSNSFPLLKAICCIPQLQFKKQTKSLTGILFIV